MPCLTPADFEGLASGLIDEGQRSEAHRHMNSCGDCRGAYEEFRDRRARVWSAETVITPRSEAVTLAAPDGPTSESKLPRIDGYTITGVLGQGGMGIVYRAVQTKLNRTVALKVLPAMVGSASPSAVQRFRREATAAARLHHTNIIPIYDFGECPDAHYYAMELITGEPLNDLVRKFAEKCARNPSAAHLTSILHDLSMPSIMRPGIDISGADASLDGTLAGSSRGRSYFRLIARWIADAADALHYAHSQGIIHRDIKPSNLILCTDGRIMLADFGLAKSAGEHSVTRTGSIVGTLRYVSPEQAMARRVRVDHRTDIYSLGATLYELLCLQPAYPGTDEKEILGSIISRDPPRPRKLNASVPAELDTICMKCLEKSPDARYESARVLAEDLRRYCNDLPIVARRPNIAQQAARYVRRHKAPVVAVTAALLLATSILFWTRESAARKRAEISSRNDSAHAYVLSNRWREAESELNLALALDPDNVETLLNVAWSKLEYFKALPQQAGQESQEQAVAACRKILKTDPENIRALGFMGIALRRLERYSEAIEPLEKALAIDPGAYHNWTNLGTLYAGNGDLAKAEEYLRKGTELAGIAEDRWHAAVWRNLAVLELYMKRSSAMLYIDNAIQCNSADTWAWVLRSRSQMELADHLDSSGALDDAKHADRMGKMADPKAKRVLAMAYLRTGDFSRAAEEAKRARELGDEPSINYLIAAAAAGQSGKSEDARKNLEDARHAWPQALRTRGSFTARADTGDLWMDSADERFALVEQIESRLAKQP